MKQLIQIFILLLAFVSCNRSDFEADDFPQEEITNVILNVKDLSTNVTKSYNYAVGGTLPNVLLNDGKTYEVGIVFLNGNNSINQAIVNAKDEHFLVFNFPNSEVELTRNDTEIRTDGNKVGIKTTWKVNNAVKTGFNAKVIVTLIHDAVSVSEAQNGTAWGSVNGGETDAEAEFTITE